MMRPWGRVLCLLLGSLLLPLLDARLCTPRIYHRKTSHSSFLHVVQDFFHCASREPDEDDVSLLTQLSVGRLPFLRTTLHVWTGPATVVVQMDGETDCQALMQLLQESQSADIVQRVDFHLVWKESSNEPYPVNVMRNVGLANLRTNFVFYVDVDFIPSQDAYTAIRGHIVSRNWDAMEKRLLVAPALELIGSGQHKEENLRRFPFTKAKVLKLLKRKAVTVFHEANCRKCHGCTDTARWRTETDLYTINCSLSDRLNYEPYLVMRRDAPPWDERFEGYGRNKVTNILEMWYQGYQFSVLPDVFVVHAPHPTSPFSTTKFQNDMWKLLGRFHDQIKYHYETWENRTNFPFSQLGYRARDYDDDDGATNKKREPMVIEDTHLQDRRQEEMQEVQECPPRVRSSVLLQLAYVGVIVYMVQRMKARERPLWILVVTSVLLLAGTWEITPSR